MSEPQTTTPGQLVYEAYCAFGARITKTPATPWSWLAPVEHAQWEAAAQAVLDHAAFPPLDLRLEETQT